MPLLTSSRLGLPFLAAGQAQKDVTHNEALALVDAALAAAAESAGLNAAPMAPAPGQCWIVGPAPAGAWAGHADALVCWTEGGWRFVPAPDGMRVWLKDQRLWATRDGGSWRIGAERAASLTIGTHQVIGPREPAIAAPSGGGTVDAEARDAIAAIIARLASHGLIAP